MDLTKTGIVVGAMVGFFLGASISLDSTPSLMGRVTGGAIVGDLNGLGFSFLYSLVGAVIFGVIFAAVLMGIEEIRNLIKKES